MSLNQCPHITAAEKAVRDAETKLADARLHLMNERREHGLSETIKYSGAMSPTVSAVANGGSGSNGNGHRPMPFWGVDVKPPAIQFGQVNRLPEQEPPAPPPPPLNVSITLAPDKRVLLELSAKHAHRNPAEQVAHIIDRYLRGVHVNGLK